MGKKPGELEDDISIHALREEGDLARRKESDEKLISIHALREEGDLMSKTRLIMLLNFYPRPPRGGRRVQWLHKILAQPISIHALREEGD